jgi:hypothetical protein
MTFQKDLQFGKTYEQLTLKFLKKQITDDVLTVSKGKFKPYDIINESTGEKYEVKCDRLTYKSGNICIEYQCNNSDSGITSTESNFYFYYVVNPTSTTNVYERVYKIPTEDLRQMIAKKQYHKTQNGGDGWRSKFYLFRENLFSLYIISTHE